MTDRPLEGIEAVFASPTYGNVDPLCAKDLRVAMMSAAAKGVHWLADASPDRLGYSAARNAVAKTLRQNAPTADGIMWVDSDIRMNPDAIVRLLTTVRLHKLDFVSGVYHSRKPPYLPIIYHWQEEVGKYLQCVTYPKDQIISLDACGFGFVWTSTATINAIADSPAFTALGGWFPDGRTGGGFGEDIAFCDLARKAGIQLFLDTGVQVGHTGDPKVIWEQDFRALSLTIDSPEIQKSHGDGDWGKVN